MYSYSPAFSAMSPTALLLSSASPSSACRSLRTKSMFAPVRRSAERRERTKGRREDGYRMAEVQPLN